jgi:hypothetical protein
MTPSDDPANEAPTRLRVPRNEPTLDTGTLSPPTEPPTGLPFYYSTERNELWVWDGSRWVGFAQIYV